MKSFRLEIVTPNGKIFEKWVTKVFLRTRSGDMIVMKGHIPLVAIIRPCECRVDFEDGKNEKIILSGGILSVFKDGTKIITNEL